MIERSQAVGGMYDFAPGGTYLAPVMVGFPLDILFERGKESAITLAAILSCSNRASRRIAGKSSSGRLAAMHHAAASLSAGHRAWAQNGAGHYDHEAHLLSDLCKRQGLPYAPSVEVCRRALPQTPPADRVCCPIRRPAAGIMWAISGDVAAAPQWVPRHIVDDGAKLYIVYPEITLFKSVPLVRKIGPNGPQLVNSRQFLNTVILDELPARVELRVGTEHVCRDRHDHARPAADHQLSGRSGLPGWPAAATQLSAR